MPRDDGVPYQDHCGWVLDALFAVLIEGKRAPCFLLSRFGRGLGKKRKPFLLAQQIKQAKLFLPSIFCCHGNCAQVITAVHSSKRRVMGGFRWNFVGFNPDAASSS